jgi:hypothetical protein
MTISTKAVVRKKLISLALANFSGYFTFSLSPEKRASVQLMYT